MRVKNIFLFIELILSIFLLSGCSNVAGLDEQLIVYGIGVDKIDDMYELTLQSLNTQNTSNSNSKDDKKTLENVSSKGHTLIEAVSFIENQVGKKILYSHALVLIIGEDTAKNGINEIITFFSTNHKLRPTVEVLISNTTAKKVFFNEREEKNINSEDILAMTKIGKKNDAINSNIRYLLGALNNSLKAAKVWYLEYDDEKLNCKKIALFQSDKLTSILDEDKTKGTILILGKAKNISDKINNKTISYQITNADSKINVNLKKNKPEFNIELNTSVELYSVDDEIALRDLKVIVENRIAELINNAIDTCIKRNNSDIFNFNKYIMNTDSIFFKSNESHIKEVIQNAEFKTTVKTKIKYMGQNQKITNLVF